MPRILAQVVDSLNKLETSVRERHKDVSVIYNGFFSPLNAPSPCMFAGWRGGVEDDHWVCVRAALPDADRQGHGSHHLWTRFAAVERSVCCV